jgi:methyl-accepting chemotaxis protein
VLLQGKGTRLAEQITQEIKILVDLKIQQAKQKADDNTLRVNTTINNMLIIFMLGAFCAIILTIYLSRTITEPLKTALDAADYISARDLTVEIQDEKRLDEPGELLQSFRVMCINLRGEIKQIMEGVNVLSTSAAEISVSMTQFTSTSSETAAAVSQATVTMEELRQTAQISSQKANYVSDIAQKAVDISVLGQNSLVKTVESMDIIKKKMDSIAKSIISLSEQSQAIGEIISSVEDIAEQTNLLAVNASIEAAKAGEYGKGFTVVAQEITNLSNQSKRATAQIGSILNEIQKATGVAVMVTEQGAKAVESGIAQSVETGESILALTNTINEAAQSVTQIALSSQQQTLGVDQVASALENIHRASVQNLGGAKQLEDSANNLEVLGQKLKQLVDGYRV